MLSVLITTYNYDTFLLVKELHQQLMKTAIQFEIICIDDASNSNLNTKNEQINTLENARFTSLSKNTGRSALRNLLAQKAHYKWLLFLDGDVLPTSNNFITQYLASIKLAKDIVFLGGISYQNNVKNKSLLRYKYGKKHEEISVAKRNKQPYKYFFTANFLIDKKLFESIKFEEQLTQYGREDSLFSLQLQEKNISIKHIENPVFHLGIDTDVVFFDKTMKAMENLCFLAKEGFVDDKTVFILRVVSFFKKLKSANFIARFFEKLKVLTLKKTSVFYLQCAKVSYLCYLCKND